MKKAWDKSVWFCEAEYLSAKWRASFYQGSWLLIQPWFEVFFHWCMDGITAHIKHHAELWDKFRPEEDHQAHLEAHGRFFKMPVLTNIDKRLLTNDFYVHWNNKSNFKEN